MVAGLKPEDFDSKLEETDLKFGASEVPEEPGLKSGDSDWTLEDFDSIFEDSDSTLGETDLKFGAFESFEMILGQKSASGRQYFVSNMKNQ